MPVTLQFLEKTPAFCALEPSHRATLARILDYRPFPAKTLICVQGQPGETMYFIEKGEVVCYTHDAHGEKKNFRTLKPGDFFGDVAVLGRGVRSAYAETVGEVFVWELHRDHVEAFVRACPDIAVTLLREMANRLDTSGAMLHDTVSTNTAQKIDATRTDTEKQVEKWVRRLGGLPFLALNGVGCLLWIGVNKLLAKPWDSREFGFLALFLAFEALVVTVLVLAKQNRDEKDANLRNDIILEKVQTAPQEIQHLRANVKALTELIHDERHDRLPPPK